MWLFAISWHNISVSSMSTRSLPTDLCSGSAGTPGVSSMMTTSKEERCWYLEHYLPGAPPPSGDRNQGLLPHINLAIIADPVLSDLVPFACLKSSWLSPRVGITITWAPLPGCKQLKYTCSCREILEIIQGTSWQFAAYLLFRSASTSLLKELESHLPPPSQIQRKPFLWDYSAHQTFLGTQQKQTWKWDKFSVFPACASCWQKDWEEWQAWKGTVLWAKKGDIRKVVLGRTHVKFVRISGRA